MDSTYAPDDPRHVDEVLNHIAHLEQEQVDAIRNELNHWAKMRWVREFNDTLDRVRDWIESHT